MQPLDLNLATRPFRNNTLLWVLFVGSALGLAFWSYWNVTKYRESRFLLDNLGAQSQEAREEIGQLDRRDQAADAGIRGFPVQALQVQADKANDVILWKAFSWTRLFNDLQEVLPWNVQMSSIRPVFRDPRRRKKSEETGPKLVPVYVEGVAKRLEDFLELQTALIEDERFTVVEPDGYQKDEVTQEIVFRLRFLYVLPDMAPPEPAVPEEVDVAQADAAENEPADEAPPEQEEPTQPQPAEADADVEATNAEPNEKEAS